MCRSGGHGAGGGTTLNSSNPNTEVREKNQDASFERIKPIIVGFFRIGWESGSNPRTIRLIRTNPHKSGILKFLCFSWRPCKSLNKRKIATYSPISKIFGPNRSCQPDLLFQNFTPSNKFLRRRRDEQTNDLTEASCRIIIGGYKISAVRC